MSETLSYRDLYITTEKIERTSIKDLPWGMQVVCSRLGGWMLWDMKGSETVLAGEYDQKSLRLDVAGFVIFDSFESGGGA